MSARSWWTGFVPVVALATVAFWLTAYPTITWWDSSQYSLAAATVGITGSPGSLLLTLLGWPVARLAPGSPAHALNLLAGLLAGLTAGMVVLCAGRLLRERGRTGQAAALGAALGGLTVAFGATLWEHAIKFTPYVLTALVTGLILWTLIRWWEEADDPRAWRRLLLLGVLVGLDFSVHRTNALLVPSVVAWVLIRHPRTLTMPRAWAAGVGGLLAGLAVQLLLLPIAATTGSGLNMGEPSSWGRFWSYVAIEERGGGFLVQFLPRNAPFWSVQVGDLVRVMGANFFRWSGPLGPLGMLPGLLGVVGLAKLWRRDRRLGTAFGALVLLHATTTVLYFNIPADYFRPFDRHYLPVCVTFGVAVAYGLTVLTGEAAALLARGRRPVAVAGGILAALVPVTQLVDGWAAHDASDRYFARDFAANALAGLPPDAILFTVGDNDTFPLWYLQWAEGVRPDVLVVNRSLLNAPWYVDQLARRDALPISLTRDERLALAPRAWRDTTLVIPVEGTAESLGLPGGAAVPAAITLDARATPGSPVLPADLVTLDLLRTNRWRRPLCYSVTGSAQAMGWLEPYGRLDGLFWRIVPVASPPADVDLMRENMLGKYRYRGYADTAVALDDVSRIMGLQYVAGFTGLAREEGKGGGPDRCRAIVARWTAALPPERLFPVFPPRLGVSRICR